jgi:hypothetical protein
MTLPSPGITAILAAAIAIVVAAAAGSGPPTSAQTDPIVSVDALSDASNTANTVGPIDTCVAIYNNGVKDGDETGIDTIDVDVVIQGVTNISGFQGDLFYQPTVLEVTAVDYDFLLGTTSASVLHLGNSTPDTDGDFFMAAAMFSPFIVIGADGDGVLARVTLHAVASGSSPLDLENVKLSDADGNPIPPFDASNFYAGPINDASVAVDSSCADADGDTVPDVSDNCPTTYNPSQTDIDGDGLGDECDDDKDGDGFANDEETARGSIDTDAGSTPEVCDDAVTDEDGDGLFNEGYDYLPLPSGNGVPDCTENVDTDGDLIPNPSDTDDDNDGFSDIVENWTATNSLDGCADTTTYSDEWDDKWAPDADDTCTVNILDVLKFKPAFNSSAGDIAWRRRFDLDASGGVNILDILKIKPHFGATCPA